MAARGRVLTILAGGFLGLDGVLLLIAGSLLDRWVLTVWGVVFLAGAVGTVFLWRRYQRHLADLDVARADLRREAGRLGATVRNGKGVGDR